MYKMRETQVYIFKPLKDLKSFYKKLLIYYSEYVILIHTNLW